MLKLIAIAFLIAVIAAIKYLPWYATIAGFFAVVLGVKLFGGKLLEHLLLTPFKLKGQVLRDAQLVVHSVAPASEPERGEALDEDEDDEDPESHEVARDYFMIEMTIRPGPPTGKFTLWEPAELVFVVPGTDPLDLEDSEDPAGEICSVWVHDGDGFVDDEQMKYPGEQRLRAHIAVEPGAKQLVAQYYFEQFGQIDLSEVDAREPVVV